MPKQILPAMNISFRGFMFLLAIASFLVLLFPHVSFGQAPPVVPTTDVTHLDDEESMSTPLTEQRRDAQDHTVEARRRERQLSPARPDDPPSDSDQGKGSEKDVPDDPQEQQITKKTKPYWLIDLGYCLPSGQYYWVTKAGIRQGVVPNPVYAQRPPIPGGLAPGRFDDSAYPAMVDQLMALIPDESKGTPISNAEFATLCAAQAEQVAEILHDPERRIHQAQAELAAKQADAANTAAEDAEANADAAMENMSNFIINVANEAAGKATSSRAPSKTYSQAIWMVQQMYKQCYVPMALLLLLPGAVLTQAKSLVGFGILGARDDDSASPFSGIIRGLIAIFLIPATQLSVSYLVDTANALTGCVVECLNSNGGTEILEKWGHEQTYNHDEDQYKNYINNQQPRPEDPEVGKVSGQPEEKGRFERTTMPSAMMQLWYNSLNNLISEGLAALNGFQLVMLCYLYLLGPLAAAFFAWPSGIGRDLFKKVFSSWLDGLSILVLWKFWWNVILLCMALRLNSGLVKNPTDEFEMYIYTAFMVMLLAVPFNPLEFRPGDLVSQVLSKAQQQAAEQQAKAKQS